MLKSELWADYSLTIASIAQSFVSVCHQTMTSDQIKLWSTGEISPNDCMDANLVLDGIIENHGIELWILDGCMDADGIEFFNQCYEASKKLNANLVSKKEIT
jgi:hypothetical protein